MLYSLLRRYLPNGPALVLAALGYACLILLIYLVADSPDGQFRYINL